MEQKTVMTLEFAKGEEMIASNVMALIATARNGGSVETSFKPGKPMEDKIEHGSTKNPRSSREEPEDNDDDARDERDDNNEAYTEIQLRDMPVKKLTDILKKEFNIDPNDYDGRNSNKKLRDLILDAQAGNLPENGDEPEDNDDDARNERGGGNTDVTHVTHDDIRDLMAEVIEEDEANRPKVLKQLNKIGAKSVGTIKDEDVADFFEFLQSLKD